MAKLVTLMASAIRVAPLAPSAFDERFSDVNAPLSLSISAIACALLAWNPFFFMDKEITVVLDLRTSQMVLQPASPRLLSSRTSTDMAPLSLMSKSMS